jgi:putative ABC transport system permease protein
VIRDAEVKYRERSASNVFLVGTNEAYRETSNCLPESGRFLTGLDTSRNRYVCLLGSEVATTLFEGSNPLGRRVSIGGRSFEVVGVMEKQGRFFDFSLDNRVIIPIGAFYKVFGSRRSVTVEVAVGSAAEVEDARDEITGILRRRRGLTPDQDDDFAVNHQSAILNIYHQITAGVYSAGIGIASIALLVGGIGIMNIMLVSVSERTREIGVRKALGARRSVILGQFLIEAMMICSGGGILGIALAYVISRVIAAMSPLPTSMPLWVVVLGLAFSSIVGIIFGLVPAWRAARLDPVDALRYE